MKPRVNILLEGEVVDGSICHFDLSQRFQEMGMLSSVLGINSKTDLPENFEKVDSLSIASSEWWKARKVRAVLAYGLCLSEPVARAIHEAGIRLVVELDTSGDISPRMWPLVARARMADSRHSLMHAMKVHVYWLKQIGWEWRTTEEKLFNVMRWADRITVPGAEAKKHLDTLFRLRGRDELRARLVVIPWAVRDTFTKGTDLPPKEKRIVVASRLDSHQKDPVLTTRVLSRFLKRNSDYGVSIFSRGECGLAARLASEFGSRVTFQVDASRNMVRDALVRSRILLITSRYETVPVVGGIEALCCGCTLVGPPLPGFPEFIQQGRFGTIARCRSAASLVAALDYECARWSQGVDSVEIARFCRTRNSLENVAREWLKILLGETSLAITEQEPAI